MEYPVLCEIEKPLIKLYDAGGLGLIILFPSGVIFTNQTGGYSCMHPTVEGIYIPIVAEVINHEKILLDYFTNGKWAGCCDRGIDDSDADFIDELLAQYAMTSYLTVNRNRLTDSHEAWVYVNIGSHPARYPKLPGTWSEEMGSPIFGFGRREGVLTWCNSD